jgi:cyanophycinase
MKPRAFSLLPLLVLGGLLALPVDLLHAQATPSTTAVAPTPPVVGPERGSLLIVGGAMRDPAILRRFMELAGGPDAPIVIVPTAGGGDAYDESHSGLRAWREAGASNLTVLHTTDPAEADTEAFIAPLENAGGVWFEGGRQWRLVDSYGGTRSEEAFRGVLDRGGVIGGSSAGASIQGSFLVRGDTGGNEVMMGDHQRGFGYLKNVGIDQHVLRRNRQFDMVEVIEAHPELLGIGIDEDTGIVVQGDQFEVIGQSLVLIYDNQRITGPDGRFYFLVPGDRYNLATREAVRPGNGGERPVEGTRPEPWPRR